jgi:hypothetical protein
MHDVDCVFESEEATIMQTDRMSLRQTCRTARQSLVALAFIFLARYAGICGYVSRHVSPIIHTWE